MSPEATSAGILQPSVLSGSDTRPKIQYWVSCGSYLRNKQTSTFYNGYEGDNSAEFECTYKLASPLNQSKMREIWLTEDHGLRFENDGTVIACEALKEVH
jgi:hypothetical protein